MKTNTAIQKSKEILISTMIAFEEMTEEKDKALKRPKIIQDHITTSQKDIFSALIVDLEELKVEDSKVGVAFFKKNKHKYLFETPRDQSTHNQAISQAQLIIRKAMEI